jgi:hypothetical protein
MLLKMRILFFQSKLPDYSLSHLKGLPLFVRSPEDPSFCLLPKFITLRKARKLASLKIPHLVWILPVGQLTSYIVNPKLLEILEPLYFLSDHIYDRRYLRAEKSLYKLPPVKVDISTFFLKTTEMLDKEKALFYPKRAFSFYFKGDTTDRLQSTSYLKALDHRLDLLKKPSLSFVYRFLKGSLDV